MSKILKIAGVGLFIFSVWKITAPPSIGWVDSGVIAAAANTLGIPNPPGFPLYLIIANLFSRIPAGSAVFRLQLLSMLSGLGIIYIVWKLSGKFTENEKSGQAASLAAALATAFSYGVWSQSVNIETYAFTNFLLFSWLWLAICRKGLIYGRNLIILGFLAGVSLGVNPTIAVLIPAAGWWVWRHNRSTGRQVMAAAVAGLLGFAIIYSYLPLRAAAHPFLNWGDPVTVSRIRNHLFGSGLNIYEPETNSINGFTWQPVIIWESFRHFWELAIWQFTPLLFLLVVAGAYKMFKKFREEFYLLLIPFIFNLLFVSLYYGGNQESWMITSWVIFGIWLGIGIAATAAKFQIVLVGVIPLLFWFPLADRSKLNLIDRYAVDMYKNVPTESVIVGSGDFFNSLTAFTHEVSGYRKDVIPVTGNMFYIFDWYRRNLSLNTGLNISSETESLIRYKSVDEFTEAVDSLVRDNPDRQFFVTPLLLRDSVVAGTRDGNYHTKNYDLLPHGLLLKVVPKGWEELPDEEILAGDISFGKPFYLERNYKNAYRLLRSDYGSALAWLGEYWFNRQEYGKAEAFFQKAAMFGAPDSAEFTGRLAIFYAQIGQSEQARGLFQRALSIDPDNEQMKQNYKIFQEQQSQVPPEPQPEGSHPSIYQGKGFSFNYPEGWTVSETEGRTTITDPASGFSVAISLKSRPAQISIDEFLANEPPIEGVLVNQGQAKIPNTDSAFVRIFDQNGVAAMQFFLFKSGIVLEMEVAPADSPLMKEFDGIVTSLEYE